MKIERELPNGIINPFSDKFLDTWLMWKEYKKEAFGFEYKGIYSQQMSLKKLCELSEGDEQKAIGIVEQSVMRQWQGFFPLHIPSTNGRSKKQSDSQPKKQSTGSSDTGLRSAITERYGDWQAPGSESHLKAV